MYYELLGNATFFFLILFYLFSEVYQLRKAKEGTIEAFSETPYDFKGIAGAEAKVRLLNGEIVNAQASPCTLCLGRLKAGDKVNLVKIKDRYSIKLLFCPIKEKRKFTGDGASSLYFAKRCASVPEHVISNG